jgi:hypothetical protein
VSDEGSGTDSGGRGAEPGEVTEEVVRDMEQTALGAGHPVALTVEEVEAHRSPEEDPPTPG